MPNTDDPSSSDQQSSNVILSVSNPFLKDTDPASIRVFLKQYDQYCRTVIARAKQLKSTEGSSSATTEATLSMQLKCCVDTQHFISCIALGFIDDVTSFDDMTDKQLRTYLDSEAMESKDAVTIDL